MQERDLHPDSDATLPAPEPVEAPSQLSGVDSASIAAESCDGARNGAPSLRVRKRRATRDALRNSAIALVAQRGLSAVTIEDIAAAAEVSPRTFFNYFASKEDAVTGFDPDELAELVAELRRRPAEESPLAALTATLVIYLERYVAGHEDLRARLRLTKSDPHLVANHVARWGDTERQLVDALAERRAMDPAHDHYAALVVATTLAAGRVALMAWCEKEGAVPLRDELETSFAVLAGGLADPSRGVEPGHSAVARSVSAAAPGTERPTP